MKAFILIPWILGWGRIEPSEPNYREVPHEIHVYDVHSKKPRFRSEKRRAGMKKKQIAKRRAKKKV